MGRLTIQEVARVLMTKNGLKLSEANRFASELFAIIQERLEQNDLIKVKGLGTFKVITVEARESVSVRTGDRVMIEGHSKITFTPDATMKELVNKPFSQFETVVLNDNVEFDDMKEQEDDTEADTDSEFDDIKDDLTEEELAQLEQLEQQEPPVVKEEPQVIEEKPQAIEEEPQVIEKEAPVVAPLIEVPEETKESEQESEQEPEQELEREEEPVAEQVDDSVEEHLAEPEEEPVVFDDEEEETSRSWSKWLWITFGAICLACLSAAGGYYYGCRHTAMLALSDTVVVRDTVYVAEPQDTAITEIPAKLVAEPEAPKVEEPKMEKPKAEPQIVEPQKAEPKKVETPKVEKPKSEPAPDVDPYAQKDERVRLGAYRIVGLEREVTVLQGQTFYSICRAQLGPDMECYIEVYNNLPRNPQIKAGQVIKIPKLQPKKRKKQ
jgi:nucleoid DNA-binding protein